MDDDVDAGAVARGGVLAPGLSSLSDDELTVGFDRALAVSRRAEWERLALEAEIGHRQMYRTDGVRSLRAWIGLRTGEGDRAAYGRALMARTLPGFPRLGEALADGRLSLAHVQLLLTLAELTGAEERELLVLGESHTVPQLETACRAARRLRRHVDQEGHDRRSVRWWRDDDGTFHLRGCLHGIDGLTVTNLLSAMAEQAEVDPATGVHDAFESRCADALVELCTGPEGGGADRPGVVIHANLDALHPGPHDDPAPHPEQRTGPAPEPELDDGSSLDPVDDLDHNPALDPGERSDVDDPELDDQPARDVVDKPRGWPWESGGGAVSMTWDGTPISNATLRRLLCDTRIRLSLEDRDGRPVGIGRQSRSIPTWLLEQLRWRDQHCRFPGCESTRWLHGHHLVHWTDGGRTDVANLALLCGRHHRALHEGDWRLQGDPDGELTFIAPTGRRYHSCPAIRPERLRRRRRPRRMAHPGRDPAPPVHLRT